jgi:hypothetical protein
MSQIKPSILINPNYATNGISSDTQQAGWYQISPNTSNLALRVNYSNIGLSGEIRLNTTTGIFQGSNGTAWVDFSSTQGTQGIPGKDFTNAVNFNNLGSNTSAGDNVSLASIFATTYANVAASISNVNVRSLKGGTYTVNSNLTINSMSLSQNSNVITLSPQPLPYIPFNTFPNNQKSYLKNSPNDVSYFSWGETSYWSVHQNATIVKGQAVRLTNDLNSTNLVIAPITYTTLVGASPFNLPFNVLGIAINSAIGGGIAGVCTKGMTTALCTSNIASGFSPVNDIPFVGAYGLICKDGGLFCVNSDPTVSYMKAGYFLESGIGLAANNSNVLFYVDPSSSF